MECSSGAQTIIIKIESERIICPSIGGIIYPNGFKGYLECPSYDEVCPQNGEPVCNEMFSCLTKSANKYNFNYKTSYYDSEGPETEIQIIRTTDKSYYISINFILALLGFIFIYF